MFWIYYCDAQKIIKECEENFFGAEKKDYESNYINVTSEQCRRAMKFKTSGYGKLGRIRTNEWITMNKKKYHCAWLKDDKEQYIKFRMRRFQAAIEGTEEVIQQQITATECLIKKMECKPEEQRQGQLVWEPVRHDSSAFESMGRYTIHQTGKFVMISRLGIGGMEQKGSSN